MQKNYAVHRVKSGRTVALGLREKRRLIQLIVCVVLFLVVFVGKGVAPEVFQTGDALLQMIQSDTDFAGAFSAVGAALAEGEPVQETLAKLSVEILGGARPNEKTVSDALRADPQAKRMAATLTQSATPQAILAGRGISVPSQMPTLQTEEVAQPEPEPQPQPEPVKSIPAYTGPKPPTDATMEYVSLGIAETVTPVQGELSSSFGYRDHPITGTYCFHNGIDLAADKGTAVAAFASGTVDFIGESEAYGLYIQLNHGNGVTTFYCHCSQLFARKGESVAVGQTIAAVGDTGDTTGAHLHWEIERNGVRLNPAYYIETL